MSGPRFDLPEFVAELEGEVPGDDRRALGELHRLLQPSLPPASAASRLLQAVDELPLRYAPFFDRLGALWDLPVESVEAVLERARAPEAWRKSALPGLRLIDVEGGERVRGADVHLVRFSPGMRFPKHRHPGDEALFVLEGSYKDSSGRVAVRAICTRWPPVASTASSSRAASRALPPRSSEDASSPAG